MSEDRTRMHVGGASPYDVVVGHGVLDELRVAARPGRPPRRGLPRRSRSPRSPTRCVAGARPSVEVLPITAPRRRGGQDRAGGGRRAGSARPGRVHPLRRGRHLRRRRHHRRRRLHRGDLAARRARRPRARRRCSAWSTRRSAARPASTPAPARTSSAPSTSRPGCSATSTCSASLPQAELVAGLGEVDQVRLRRRPRDPPHRRGRPGGGPRPRLAPAARGHRARDPGQGRRRRRRPQGDRRRRRASRVARCSTTATRWPTRSRRAPATASGTARPSRWAWSTSPSWPGWPAASTTRRPRGTPRCSASVGLPTRFDELPVRGRARHHAGRQEVARLGAAVRGARRAGRAGRAGRPVRGPTCGRRTTC